MLWFKRRSRAGDGAAKARPSIPDGQVVYAVGDIHGRADLLLRLKDAIARDLERQPPAQATTVFLGDYVDRGPASREVLDVFVRSAFPTPVVALLGNHETMVLDFLQDATLLHRWRALGGLETLFSYGVDVRQAQAGRGYDEAQQRFHAVFPETHRRFILERQLSIEIGDYFFCHAGVRPGVPLPQQSANDLIWIRGEFLTSDADHGKVIVHGHTPVSAPEFKPNRINLDTGAYVTGRLACLRLEGDQQCILAV
jgi:serine/threonine protein phosphatase 1